MRWLEGITNSMDMSLNELPGVGDRQEGLVCCDSWARKESDTTERLNVQNRNLEPGLPTISSKMLLQSPQTKEEKSHLS